MKNEVIIIAAIGKNNELGKNNDLIWKIPGDLKRFKELTWGHPIIMGYRTFKSLRSRALPGRTNIVMALTETVDGDVEVARSLNDAIAIAKE
ncbi:MAG TPA: dihydrofolate reductase, partial [Candidatus Pacebacteria bacterium]|nr:dihydrofolate reductase [Candidatus Paceibacterota bacterium]